MIHSDSQIMDALGDVSPRYANRSIDMILLPAVSGDFYAETWQAISYVTHNFEHWQRNCEKNKLMLLASISLVMIVLIVAMFTSDRLPFFYFYTYSYLLLILYI